MPCCRPGRPWLWMRPAGVTKAFSARLPSSLFRSMRVILGRFVRHMRLRKTCHNTHASAQGAPEMCIQRQKRAGALHPGCGLGVKPKSFDASLGALSQSSKRARARERESEASEALFRSLAASLSSSLARTAREFSSVQDGPPGLGPWPLRLDRLPSGTRRHAHTGLIGLRCGSIGQRM